MRCVRTDGDGHAQPSRSDRRVTQRSHRPARQGPRRMLPLRGRCSFRMAGAITSSYWRTTHQFGALSPEVAIRGYFRRDYSEADRRQCTNAVSWAPENNATTPEKPNCTTNIVANKVTLTRHTIARASTWLVRDDRRSMWPPRCSLRLPASHWLRATTGLGSTAYAMREKSNMASCIGQD